jgi:serine protease Do
MIEEYKIAELTEKYLNGGLSDTEKELFLLMVNSNEDYKLQFDQYKTIQDTFRHIALKNEISEIIFQTGKIKKKKPSWYSGVVMNRVKMYAAAAAISALVVLGTLFSTGYFSIKKDQSSSYTLLKNTLINITKRQASFINANNENKEPISYASGTCFPISLNGYFITSLHLVKNASNVYLSSSDDTTRFISDVVMKDSIHDIAIVRISDSSFTSFKNLPFTINDKQYEIGEYVYTLGYSKDGIVFNEGSISSVTGYLEDSTAYQLSIPANPGNSGGPIISSGGEILGILLAKNPGFDDATFALKSYYIRNLVDSLKGDPDYELIIPKQSTFKTKDKVQFIKQIKPFIYRIEVY